MKIKLQIKNRLTGSLIFEYEKEDNTMKQTVLEALKSYADLSYADLSYADLSYADLRSADLRSADLRSADLSYADLSYADLSSADLSSADLRSADLRSIKPDFFEVLLHSIPEIQFLKQNIIEGKIDGSTYEGECSCLSGTLERGAKVHNGPNEKIIKDSILSCRDSSRPIERLFLAIKKGDTPETNAMSKIALEWLEEFEGLLTTAFVHMADQV